MPIFIRMDDFPAHETIPSLDDGYFREKIAEAYAEGGLEPLDMAAIKA
jgi:hypothetical protein